MTKVKSNDFVEIEYTGMLKENNLVFDTTDEALAKKAHIHGKNSVYGPRIVCVGQNHILKGIDEFLLDKEPGTYQLDIPPEKGFGKKNPKFIQLMNTALFKKEDINPVPGLQVNIDGALGVIKTVSGGRTLVDFNHPLAGKELHYEIKLNKIVTDTKTKIKAVIENALPVKDANVEVNDSKATIKLPQEMPKEVQEQLTALIKKLVDIKDIDYKTE